MTLSQEDLRRIKQSLPPIPSMLGQLHDVKITARPANGQALVWVDADSAFEPDSGGFDPNETRVLIGSGATAGGSSTPTNLAGAAARATVVGPGATYTIVSGSTDPTVVGSGASGKGYRPVAVGYGAQALDDDTTAVGPSSSAFTFGDSAFGKNSQATGGKDTALGFGASATHGASTAVGANSATTAANQIMLGTFAETVVMPGNFNASALPTTNPGAGSGLVWNNGGVLTVA